MATVSQTGYRMLQDYGDPALMPNPVVPGTDGVRIYGGLLAGPPGICLLYYAARFHREVENLGNGVVDDWGFDPQHNSTTTTSDHKSGTAMDLNSTMHPQHVRGTFSGAQYDTMRRIAADLAVPAGGPVIRLGIDWSGSSVDEMHVSGAKAVAGTGRMEAAAAAILAGRVPNVPAELLEVPRPPATNPPPNPNDGELMDPEVLAELRLMNQNLAALLASQQATHRNAMDARSFLEQIRESASAIASGRSVVKVTGKVTTL